MIQGLEFSIKNLGGGGGPVRAQEYSAQEYSAQEYSAPGWYWHPQYGWVYVDASGTVYTYNLYGTQQYTPMALENPTVYLASTIGGPINVVTGDTIRVNWSFKYQGESKTYRIRVGNANKIAGIPQWDRGDSSLYRDVKVGPDTTPRVYPGTDDFKYLAAVLNKPDMFVEIEVPWYASHIGTVYTGAFTVADAEITELKIANYARL